jgi:hypothetical protein
VWGKLNTPVVSDVSPRLLSLKLYSKLKVFYILYFLLLVSVFEILSQIKFDSKRGDKETSENNLRVFLVNFAVRPIASTSIMLFRIKVPTIINCKRLAEIHLHYADKEKKIKSHTISKWSEKKQLDIYSFKKPFLYCYCCSCNEFNNSFSLKLVVAALSS